MLSAEYEEPQKERLFSGEVHVTADLKTTTVFNTMFVDGKVTVQNWKYNVSEKQYVPRSLLARLDQSYEAAGTMTLDYFNTFWFEFNFPEPESGEYGMWMEISLSRSRISIDVSRPEKREIPLAHYSGRLE